MKNKLTNRQKTFARKIVEGIYSNTECARLAGYSEERANEYASRLLNGRDYPHVLEYITELRQEKERNMQDYDHIIGLLHIKYSDIFVGNEALIDKLFLRLNIPKSDLFNSSGTSL